MPGPRVIVVDDNALSLKLAQVALTSDGYEVRTAANATELFSLLQEFPPVAILMDVRLPDMSGVEIIRKLKISSETRDIKIIALTAYAMKEDEEKVREAGCDAYIRKPIEIESMLRVLGAEIKPRLDPRASAGG
jgi:two-component system cell cycle response regulator DivK